MSLNDVPLNLFIPLASVVLAFVVHVLWPDQAGTPIGLLLFCGLVAFMLLTLRQRAPAQLQAMATVPAPLVVGLMCVAGGTLICTASDHQTWEILLTPSQRQLYRWGVSVALMATFAVVVRLATTGWASPRPATPSKPGPPSRPKILKVYCVDSKPSTRVDHTVSAPPVDVPSSGGEETTLLSRVQPRRAVPGDEAAPSVDIESDNEI